MSRYVNPVPQYFDSQGDILIEGFLRFDETGTNTLKPIWHDVNMTIPATNPVKLDGAGRIPSLFLSGAYKVTAFKDDGLGSPGEQQWSRDPVGGESDAFGGDWSSATVYGIGDVVRGSDGEYYQSIINSNSGNDPISIATAWSLVNLLVNWNTNETYSQFDPVKGSDGNIYYSVVASNLGNNPTADDGTNWERGSTRPETAIQAQTTHNMASDADYTLTTSQAQKAIIKITDTGVVLTTGRNIIVPDAAREWTVVNDTAETLTFKTLAGTGVAVLAGASDALKSDGANVDNQVNGSNPGDLIAETEVTGSAVTTLDVSGLDINAHNSYRIELETIDGSAGAHSVYMTVQGDHTLTNYYSQKLIGSASTPSASRANDPGISTTGASSVGYSLISLARVNGFPSAVANALQDSGSLITSRDFRWGKTATVTNITSLRFTASNANGLGVGTKVRIYRG
jgi:hypothetical protein